MSSYIVTGVPPTNPIPLRILNPMPQSDLNYDYGYQRKRPVSHLNSKARSGAPNFRELTDAIHSFTLNWADRPLSTARALKQFYEQNRGGAFIMVDHEGGGREYVGRFSTPVEPVPTRNASWTIQSVQFDELPLIPMRHYPLNWDADAVWMDPIDFDGNLQVTVVSATPASPWTAAYEATARRGLDVSIAGTDAASWAQMQYLGYGFQLWARSGPDMGIAAVLLDGQPIGTIDFYSAAVTPSAVVFLYPAVPLGTHRVKLMSTNSKNAASSGTTIVWDSLRVMR